MLSRFDLNAFKQPHIIIIINKFLRDSDSVVSTALGPQLSSAVFNDANLLLRAKTDINAVLTEALSKNFCSSDFYALRFFFDLMLATSLANNNLDSTVQEAIIRALSTNDLFFRFPVLSVKPTSTGVNSLSTDECCNAAESVLFTFTPASRSFYPVEQLDIQIFKTYWSAVNYVYLTVEKVWNYNIVTKLGTFTTWLHDNDYSLLFEILHSAMHTFVAFEFFFSLVCDVFNKNVVVLFNNTHSNVYVYLASLDPTLFLIYHPEVTFFFESERSKYYASYSLHFFFILEEFLKKNALFTPMHFFLQLSFFFIILVAIVCFFFSFFNSGKEEWQQDVDYSFNNLFLESEKELGAIDDYIYLVFLSLFIFGFYFCFFINFFNNSVTVNLTIFIFCPLFFVTILFIPLNLLIDFGLFFLIFLRGSSKTSNLLFEWLYDWMGLIAFFTRILVQFVRQILILVVYLLMQDTVILQTVEYDIVASTENFWKFIVNIPTTADNISYFLIFEIFSRIAYWLYELFHTFFVATGQIAAFIVIVFWLFLLLYTSFVNLKYEHHFNSLSRIHNNIIKRIKSLKN